MPEKIYVSIGKKGILRVTPNEGVYDKNRAIYVPEARIAELEAKLSGTLEQNKGFMSLANEKIERIAELEAEVRKLRDALEKYADPEYNGYNADGSHARKTLGDSK
jgi:hypothetical protein